VGWYLPPGRWDVWWDGWFFLGSVGEPKWNSGSSPKVKNSRDPEFRLYKPLEPQVSGSVGWYVGSVGWLVGSVVGWLVRWDGWCGRSMVYGVSGMVGGVWEMVGGFLSFRRGHRETTRALSVKETAVCGSHEWCFFLPFLWKTWTYGADNAETQVSLAQWFS
jgi:hypothetical protein